MLEKQENDNSRKWRNAVSRSIMKRPLKTGGVRRSNPEAGEFYKNVASGVANNMAGGIGSALMNQRKKVASEPEPADSGRMANAMKKTMMSASGRAMAEGAQEASNYLRKKRK